jgi:hypothetical protein
MPRDLKHERIDESDDGTVKKNRSKKNEKNSEGQPLNAKLLPMLIAAAALIFAIAVRTSAQDILWVNNLGPLQFLAGA